jgi:hypothetical protein
MGTQKTTASLNWDVSNAQVTIWPKRDIEWCLICPLWWKSSWKLQGICNLQGPIKENIPTSQFEDIHSSRTNQTNPIHSARSNICSSNQTQIICSHKHRARATYKPTPSANQLYAVIKKYYEKPFWTNGNYDKSHNHAKCSYHTYSLLLNILSCALYISPLAVQALQSRSCLCYLSYATRTDLSF